MLEEVLVPEPYTPEVKCRMVLEQGIWGEEVLVPEPNT